MKKNFKFIVAAIAAVAMIGCAKDGDNVKNNGSKAKGEKTLASVTIFQGTRSATPPGGWSDATTNEKTVNDASLYVFNEDNNLEQIVTINPTTSKGTFETFTGDHHLVVLVNQENTAAKAALGTLVTQNAVDAGATGPATTLAAFMAKQMTFANQAAFQSAVIAGAADYFMSNEEGAYKVTFVAPTDAVPVPPANNVKIKVGRSMAKLSVQYNPAVLAVVPASGIVTSMSYILNNNPKDMFVAKHLEGAIFKTPYWTSPATVNTALYYGEPETAFTAIPTVAPFYGAARFIPENSNQTVIHHGEATSLGFKAQFEPKAANYFKGIIGDGNNGAAINAYIPADAYTAGDNFYRIKDVRNGADAWVTDIYFSANPEIAVIKKALGIALASPNPKPYGKYYNGRLMADSSDPDWLQATAKYEGDFEVWEYTGGTCYYYLLLMNKDKEDAAKYDVVRNDYFWVNIDKINDCGEPTLKRATPPADEPVEKVLVNIEAEIEIRPWNPVIYEAEL